MKKLLLGVMFAALLLIPVGAQTAFAGNGVCTSTAQCGQDEFCQKATGAAPNDEGFCTLKPEICLLVEEPVCGIDGITYSNECIAHSQGVNVAHEGECIDIVVGGEFLPIDSTALMLAGLQSSAIWMLPVLAGAVGAGFAAFKLRRK